MTHMFYSIINTRFIHSIKCIFVRFIIFLFLYWVKFTGAKHVSDGEPSNRPFLNEAWKLVPMNGTAQLGLMMVIDG